MQPNYRGYEYLVRRLAAQGYVALSININAEYTFGFGEPVPVERLEKLVDLHLEALAKATSGGSNKFGVELKDRADMKLPGSIRSMAHGLRRSGWNGPTTTTSMRPCQMKRWRARADRTANRYYSRKHSEVF